MKMLMTTPVMGRRCEGRKKRSVRNNTPLVYNGDDALLYCLKAFLNILRENFSLQMAALWIFEDICMAFCNYVAHGSFVDGNFSTKVYSVISIWIKADIEIRNLVLVCAHFNHFIEYGLAIY